MSCSHYLEALSRALVSLRRRRDGRGNGRGLKIEASSWLTLEIRTYGTAFEAIAAREFVGGETVLVHEVSGLSLRDAVVRLWHRLQSEGWPERRTG